MSTFQNVLPYWVVVAKICVKVTPLSFNTEFLTITGTFHSACNIHKIIVDNLTLSWNTAGTTPCPRDAVLARYFCVSFLKEQAGQTEDGEFSCEPGEARTD